MGLKLWFHKGWFIVFCSYLAIIIAIIILAYKRLIPVQIKYIPFYDTLGHFILLGILSYLAHRALLRRNIRLSSLVVPLGPLAVGIFALVEENLQALSPHRTFSFLDLAANFCGIALFYLLDRLLSLRAALKAITRQSSDPAA